MKKTTGIEVFFFWFMLLLRPEISTTQSLQNGMKGRNLIVTGMVYYLLIFILHDPSTF